MLGISFPFVLLSLLSPLPFWKELKVGLEKSFLPYTIFTITETVQVRAVLSAAISQAHLSMKDVAAAAKGNYNPFPPLSFP